MKDILKQWFFVFAVIVICYQSALIKIAHASPSSSTVSCPTLSIQRMKISSHGVVESVTGETTCLYNLDESILIRNSKIKKHYGTK